MRGINKVILCGLVGQDPKVRTTPSGRQLCELSLATDRRVKSGEDWTTTTDWHRVTLWERDAEICQRYVRKGTAVSIEGELRTDQWTDQDGRKKSKLRVHARRLDIIGKPTRSTDPPPATRAPERTHPALAEDPASEQIPF